jgi:hypothetical protein
LPSSGEPVFPPGEPFKYIVPEIRTTAITPKAVKRIMFFFIMVNLKKLIKRLSLKGIEKINYFV